MYKLDLIKLQRRKPRLNHRILIYYVWDVGIDLCGYV
ncbi:hypothetical protein F383_03848 [Gossypium arboreum]|uniref:Uncharacterized protein n=1 Tax=Gossypium arboreum TaxID=29729 RepID=A0A0B0PIL1_GOSAR|nr:hypothetical protein F383_03848 [Gossypium arboreum]